MQVNCYRAMIWRYTNQQPRPAAFTVKDKAHHIRERFPHMHQDIDLLLKNDPEFQSLCEDHDACVNALQYWSKSKEPEAETRADEYRTLIQELKDEIQQALTAAKPLRSE